MTRTASEIVESYLARFRSELEAAGAPDTDDLVAEIRSLLADAAGDDPARALTQIERLGEPSELARGVLAERGLDDSAGMPTGLWWRLGVAAPVDIAIGLALPLAAALPLYVAAAYGQPRTASVAIALAVGLAVLAWPFFIWRPWRAGGRTLSPGMTLTGLAVVRAPGSWRLARLDELASMGLAPRRRVALAVIIALVALALLAGTTLLGVDFGTGWLASAAITAEFSRGVTGGVPLEAQLQSVVDQVYMGLRDPTDALGASDAARYVAPDAGQATEALARRIIEKRIVEVELGAPVEVRAGVYRFVVREFENGASGPDQVGSSTFTFGRREWLLPDGIGSDWVIVDIAVGTAPAE